MNYKINKSIIPLVLLVLLIAQAGLLKGQQVQLPEYHDTGNQTVDDVRYDAAKKNWVDTHPEQYKEMLPAKQSLDKNIFELNLVPDGVMDMLGLDQNVEQAPKDKVLEEVIMPEEPTFPKMIHTSNPDSDLQNYRAAKEDWIQKNPEKYQAMESVNSREPTAEELAAGHKERARILSTMPAAPEHK